MPELIIKKEYLNLIPRPSTYDYEFLKDDIIQNKQRVPIIVNQKNVIIDGYSRYKVLQELKIKPKITVKNFKSEEEEIRYILSLNLARRNLTVFQKVEMLFPFYDEFKK